MEYFSPNNKALPIFPFDDTKCQFQAGGIDLEAATSPVSLPRSFRLAAAGIYMTAEVWRFNNFILRVEEYCSFTKAISKIDTFI